MIETDELIRELRLRGAETTAIEVKSAAGGAPRSVRETLSSFSNGDGGTILLGIDEKRDFSPVAEFDAHAVRDAIAGMASDDMSPPLRSQIEIEDYREGHIVRVDVLGLEPAQKPCFVTRQGEYHGSYVRSGDGDRHLSSYEVTLLIANRGQPLDDRELISAATRADLDADVVARLLVGARLRNPRAFNELHDDDALEKLGVLGRDGDHLVPTLAGLLCLGSYPQQYFPQLNATFVALPGLTMGQPSPTGERFLDNETCDGSLPEMIDRTLRAVVRNMTRSAVIRGAGRTDHYEYPIDVVRELIVNAVMHRDYSGPSRGTQVQIELYPDRLVVRSPGGFFGGVDPAQFGGPNVTSSRNATLARLLSEVTLPRTNQLVCENRGSGIPSVLGSLKAAGMTPPTFEASISQVEVTVPHHALLDASTRAWVDSLEQSGLSEEQYMALALMHQGRDVSNETLRGWGLHRSDATSALKDLVTRGVAERTGGRRYASYTLACEARAVQPPLSLDLDHESGTQQEPSTVPPELQSILDLVRVHQPVTIKALQEQLGLSYPSTLRRINRLIADGAISSTAPTTSRNRAYVTTGITKAGPLNPNR